MYECTLLRIKYSMCGDMIPTHTQTRAGTGAYHRSVPAQISCKIRGEGRSKIKHLYFWLMLFWFWSLLSTFPAHGGCINGVPLQMTIWPAMWRHQTTPLKLQWCTVLGRGPHHPPPRPWPSPCLHAAAVMGFRTAAATTGCRYLCRYLVRETRKLVQRSVSS